MNAPVDVIISVIQKSEECRTYLTTTYPYEFEVWNRFSTKNGTACSFARAALKQIFAKELRTEDKCLIKLIMTNQSL